MKITTNLRTNKQIRAQQVRLIDATSKQIGIINFFDALKMAEESDMDLVEISGDSNPPVCKIMDYDKYIFAEKKKEKENKKLQRANFVDIKEIQINPTIHDADLNVKIKNICRLLDEGDKVKIIVRFAGRQIRHAELGKTILQKIIDAIPTAIIDAPPVFEGKHLFLILDKNKSK